MQLSEAVRHRIIYLSKTKKNNLKELCRDSGVSYSTLTSFVIGKTRILTLNTLFDICEGLGITLFDFFCDPVFNDIVDEHEKKLKK